MEADPTTLVLKVLNIKKNNNNNVGECDLVLFFVFDN